MKKKDVLRLIQQTEDRLSEQTTMKCNAVAKEIGSTNVELGAVKGDINALEKRIKALEDDASKVVLPGDSQPVLTNGGTWHATYRVISNERNVIFKNGTYQYMPKKYGKDPVHNLEVAVELCRGHNEFCEARFDSYFPAYLEVLNRPTPRITKKRIIK